MANNQTNTSVTISNDPANAPANNVIPEPNAIHRVANIANATLPEGWKKEQMANHPSVVWYEKNNGTEQWYPPGAEKNDPTMFANNTNLPAGWRKAYHRNNNIDPKLYWYVSPNNQTSWTRPNTPANISDNTPANIPANIPANTPLAPASINTVNQRESNLSPNIKTQMNRIKQKITNIHRSLRSFQAGGRQCGCATRKA
jgi:hypothetical protein